MTSSLQACAATILLCRKPDVHVCLILSRKCLTFREKERCSPESIETLGDKFHD